jgi:NitT/TauT family transport system permease protein
VVGEFFGGPLYSLGIFITNETGISDYPGAWAAIVLACLLGISFYVIAVVAERIAVPWGTARETAL